MHQYLAVILRHFNYSKNSFIVLIPGELFLGDESLDSVHGGNLIGRSGETGVSERKS